MHAPDLQETALQAPPSTAPEAPYRSFLLSFGGTTAVLLLAIAALNTIVDPYTAWKSPVSAGVYEFTVNRMGKGEILQGFTGDTVLIGNSRVKLGVQGDPDHGSETCNLGLSGASFAELKEVLRCCLERPSIRKIYFFVDVYTFRDEYGFQESFAISRFNPDRRTFDHTLDLLWNYRTGQASLQKLRALQKGDLPGYTSTGCPIPERQQAGASLAFRSERTLRSHLDGGPDSLRYSPSTVEQLRPIIRQCLKNKVELVIVNNPTHATLQQTLWQLNEWDEYQAWLQQLTQVVEDESHGKVEFWDFNGFHQYTTEPLIIADSFSAPELKWFWEPSHYRCAVGDLMLDRMDGAPYRDPTFGVELSPEMLDEHLDEMETEHEIWLRQHPREAWLVQQISETGRIGFMRPHVQIAGADETSVVR
jgi:hypothetical protein